MRKNSYAIIAIAFLIAAAGFLIPFWPLTVLGIAVMALLGYPLWAITLGLLLDLAYGAPIGTLHILVFPFTIVALASIVVREVGKRYFMDASSSDHI
ncbi:MAG TPA: hypothetical protein VG934_01330 [Candidatus Paceibacterota bacterium]|nr:hypothetical protein [Candidatus Paceibacterota bacterium]